MDEPELKLAPGNWGETRNPGRLPLEGCGRRGGPLACQDENIPTFYSLKKVAKVPVAQWISRFQLENYVALQPSAENNRKPVFPADSAELWSAPKNFSFPLAIFSIFAIILYYYPDGLPPERR